MNNGARIEFQLKKQFSNRPSKRSITVIMHRKCSYL